MSQTLHTTLDQLRTRADAADVFGEITVSPTRLQCAARESAEPAWYRVEPVADGGWEVSLVTADRWLSESIEADLMHHGDPLEELIEEELVELGFTGEVPPVKHFRSDDMLYTFSSRVPAGADGRGDETETVLRWLLAYEAAFRELGDMTADEDD